MSLTVVSIQPRIPWEECKDLSSRGWPMGMCVGCLVRCQDPSWMWVAAVYEWGPPKLYKKAREQKDSREACIHSFLLLTAAMAFLHWRLTMTGCNLELQTEIHLFFLKFLLVRLCTLSQQQKLNQDTMKMGAQSVPTFLVVLKTKQTKILKIIKARSYVSNTGLGSWFR